MVYLLPFQLLNTNISVNTFSFMNYTNLIERCQAEEGGVRQFETKLEDYKFKLLRRDEACLETEGSEFIKWNIKIN